MPIGPVSESSVQAAQQTEPESTPKRKLAQRLNESAQSARTSLARGPSDQLVKSEGSSYVSQGVQKGAQTAGLYKGVAKYIFGARGSLKKKS